MATLTIRDIDEATERRLREQANLSGRSPESEARAILESAVIPRNVEPSEGLAGRIHRRFAKYGGVELENVRDPAPRPIPFADRSDADEE